MAICATAIALVAVGCEKTTHENIDRWMRTAKGPQKLEGAVTDRGLNPDLRAHAAQNMIRTDRGEQVMETLQALADDDRQTVLAKLIPRLWNDARIEGEMTVPSGTQIAAKDALFDVRGLAGADNRAAIDKYLIEWLTSGYYAGRARTGRFQGAQIIRAIGQPAAPKLIDRARAILASPPDAKGGRVKIEEPLLVALAASGSPEAIEMVLQIAETDRNDPDLAQRAFDSLHVAFVAAENRSAGFDPVPGDALVPHLPALLAVAKDEHKPGRIINDSIDLIGAIGAPRCIQPLVELMMWPHSNEQYRWVAANAALRCGKASALVAVTDALPTKGSYQRRVLAGAIWEPIAKLDDAQVVAEQARALLDSDSWVSRIVGVELLGTLALRATAAEDAARIRELAKDKAPLRGWWGDQSDVPKRERKREPKLGERAAEVADALERRSQG